MSDIGIDLILDLLDEIKILKERKKELEKVKEQLDIKVMQAIALMESEGLDSIKKDGYAFYRTSTESYYIKKAGKEEAFGFLKAIGLEYLIKPAVNQRALSSEFKQLGLSGESLPDCFDTKIRENISVRKS